MFDGLSSTPSISSPEAFRQGLRYEAFSTRSVWDFAVLIWLFSMALIGGAAMYMIHELRWEIVEKQDSGMSWGLLLPVLLFILVGATRAAGGSRYSIELQEDQLTIFRGKPIHKAVLPPFRKLTPHH